MFGKLKQPPLLYLDVDVWDDSPLCSRWSGFETWASKWYCEWLRNPAPVGWWMFMVYPCLSRYNPHYLQWFLISKNYQLEQDFFAIHSSSEPTNLILWQGKLHMQLAHDIIDNYYIPVVPARGGPEVALGLYYTRPFSSIKLACALRQRGIGPNVTLKTPHFTLHTSHFSLHTPHFISSHLTSLHLICAVLSSSQHLFSSLLICRLSLSSSQLFSFHLSSAQPLA